MRKNYFRESMISILVLGFWMFGFVPSVAAAPGDISTVAGNGTQGFSGDGSAATSASLNKPMGTFVDGFGNVYTAEFGNHRIRKVDTSGIISTVAGNGTAGFAGDGGPATSASLNGPRDVFVDGLGNIYIADETNHRIRKVDTSGIISTVAGNGTQGFSGDGGPATSASLNNPRGVFVDVSGNIYIGDTNNHRIRKVDTSGIINTVAGNGTFAFSGDGGPATSASLNVPFGVFVDGSGNIYIADQNNHRIRKVDTSGIISTVAGNGTAGFSGDGGPATSASLNNPLGVFVDGLGNIYTAEFVNHRIRKVDAAGNISTVAGNGAAGSSGDGGQATNASLNGPHGVFVDVSGNIYIGDTNNHRIRKVEGPVPVSLPDTSISTIIGDTLSVPVVIEEDVTGLGIISAQMNISYDSNVIKVVAIELGDTLTVGWVKDDTVTTGIGTSTDTVKIVMVAPGPDTLSGSGNLVFIKFVVSDSAVIGDSTALVFERFFFNEGDPAAITADGSVRVTGLVGDVSRNGEVTAFDAALVLKSAVGLFAISDTVAADVSGDSTISAFDASLILRFVIGKISVFPAGTPKVVLAERIISLGNIKALPDGRFTVAVLIDEMDGVLSGQLELSFDPTKLKAVDARTSDLTSDYLFAHNAQNGRLKLSFAGVESVHGSGRIAEIIFEPVDSEIEAISEIALLSAQLNEGLFSVVIPQFEAISDIPDSYSLYQNYPNPFNPETVIHYDLLLRSHVDISVYNMIGQRVAILMDKEMDAGRHSIVWDGKDNNQRSLASGVYLYRIEADGFVKTRKLILMR